MRMQQLSPSLALLTQWGARVALPLLLTSCGIGDIRDASRYWHRVEEKSVSVTEMFLNAAAAGDSTAISAVATDTVLAQVMDMRRHAEAGALNAMAQQFHDRDKDVRVFGTGAWVSFTYQFAHQPLRASIRTGLVNDRLVVTKFGTHVWED